MAIPSLPHDFKEFLQSLNSSRVEYLLVGGYAVAHYGYVRATADMDVWLAISAQNAVRVVAALRSFGFDIPGLDESLFLTPRQVIRMGLPPLRIELLTTLSGVEFAECWAEREVMLIEGVEIPVISVRHLKQNKAAAGRDKDLVDLKRL